MAIPSSHEVTQLLMAWSDGDRAALDQLIPLVYEELRRLAKRQMGGERPGHTLQTTALVNEAYLRLIDSSRVHWQNRPRFFAMSAQLMRRIMVDFARARHNLKQGGKAQQVSLEEALEVAQGQSTDLVALDDAMKTLATLDPRQSQVVEMRFFGGLSVEETAEVLKFRPRQLSAIGDWLKFGSCAN